MTNGSSEFVLESSPGAEPDPVAVLAGSNGFEWADDGPVRRVRRLWLDTFDWRLYRAGLSLEQVASRDGTELVLTGRNGERLAVQPVPAGSGRHGPIAWPSLIAALPAGPLRELLEPAVGVRALAPVARAVSGVRQRKVLNSDAKTVARLAIDSMSVSYPARGQAAPRLSVWPVRGYQGQAVRLSHTLAALPGVRPTSTSALETALAAAGRPAGGRPTEVQLSAGMPSAAAMAAILAGLFDTLEANVPGTVRDIDTEFLHDLRIAVRRTRSALKLAGRALPEGIATRFRPEFRWLGDLTTPARDLDVHLLGFGSMTAGLVAATSDDMEPFRQYLLRARTVAYKDLARGLRSARFARLSGQWRSQLGAVRPVRKRMTIGEFAGRRIAVAHRRALRAGQRITAASPATDLHELRKDCKELRYLVEMFGSLHDPAQRWQAVRELKALQDCLGGFQDAEVQRAEIYSFADRMLAERSAPAATLLAMGEIAAGLAARQREARALFDSRFAAFASPASQARLAGLTRAGGR